MKKEIKNMSEIDFVVSLKMASTVITPPNLSSKDFMIMQL